MDFFEHQDAARGKTKILVCYFFLAVVLIVVAVYFAVAAIFLKMHGSDGASLWNPQLFVVVAGATVSLVFIGSLFKIAQLGAGGEVVAIGLGGRAVRRDTTDLNERMLLNVVEEMAIASGVPAPPVYVMDEEQGINAFAAGLAPDDAVIGVTRGAIEVLSRDELQGVIAHEFSHVLNGDMRLNIRLMGVLFGILLIALLGRGILRSTGRSSGRKKGGGGIVLLGLAFLVIGYVGVFFGKLIKSAVSRQREFLADASAVQFTRNPGGIAGALKKIGGLAQGALIEHPKAEDASHMFFGNALHVSFLELLSTHPPLDLRIKLLEPSFNGVFPKAVPIRRRIDDSGQAEQEQEKVRSSILARSGARKPAARRESFQFQPASFTSQVGTLRPEHVRYASALVSTLPEKLSASVHEPFGAVSTVCALLINEEPEPREAQFQHLAAQGFPGVLAQVRKLLPMIEQLSPEAKLPLVELALPALHDLSESQFRLLQQSIRQLVAADKKVTLFEYALQRMVLEHLARRMGNRKPPEAQYYSLLPMLPSCGALLSTLAYLGQRNADAAAYAFAEGAKALGKEMAKAQLLPKEQCGIATVDESLTRLASASLQIKKRVLNACAACVAADGRLTLEEGELLRVIAHSLDCPVPPIMAQQAHVSA